MWNHLLIYFKVFCVHSTLDGKLSVSPEGLVEEVQQNAGVEILNVPKVPRNCSVIPLLGFARGNRKHLCLPLTLDTHWIC